MKAPGLLSPGRLHQGSGLRVIGNLAHDLQPGSLGKLALLANRDLERSRATDDAVAKVQVQVLGFPGAGGPLQHDRQAVEDLSQEFVSEFQLLG